MEQDSSAIDRLKEVKQGSTNPFEEDMKIEPKDESLENITALSNYLNKMDDVVTNLQNIVSSGDITTSSENIKNCINEYMGLLKKTKPLMAELDKAVKTLQEDTSRPLEFQRLSHARNNLSSRLKNTMNKYIQLRGSVTQMNHDKVKRTLEINGLVATDQEVDEMIEKNDFSVLDCVAQVSKKQEALNELVRMEESFKLIEKTFIELHEYVLEFDTLLSQQQEHIDRIEYDVCTAYDYVQSAHQEVNKAVVYKKKASKKKIIIITICCIIVGIIIIIIITQVAK